MRSGANVEDHPVDSLRRRRHHHIDPDALAKLDKGLAAEFEDGAESIDDEMVVKQLVTGDHGQLAGHRELAGCRQAVDEDELHGIDVPFASTGADPLTPQRRQQRRRTAQRSPPKLE